MEFKGTKGDWECLEQPIGSLGFYIQTIDKSHKNTFIGDVGGGLQTKNEIRANAKLIASAPLLLKALIEVNNVLKMASLIDKSNTCEEAQLMCDKVIKEVLT